SGFSRTSKVRLKADPTTQESSIKNERHMTNTCCRCFLAAFVTTAVLLATPASAQYLDLTPTVVGTAQPLGTQRQGTEWPTFARPSLFRPFTDVLGDFHRLPNRTNAEFLVAGLAVAAGAHRADTDV